MLGIRWPARIRSAGARVGIAFGAIVLAMLPAVLDQTILATALPTIARRPRPGHRPVLGRDRLRRRCRRDDAAVGQARRPPRAQAHARGRARRVSSPASALVRRRAEHPAADRVPGGPGRRRRWPDDASRWRASATLSRRASAAATRATSRRRSRSRRSSARCSAACSSSTRAGAGCSIVNLPLGVARPGRPRTRAARSRRPLRSRPLDVARRRAARRRDHVP